MAPRAQTKNRKNTFYLIYLLHLSLHPYTSEDMKPNKMIAFGNTGAEEKCKVDVSRCERKHDSKKDLFLVDYVFSQ